MSNRSYLEKNCRSPKTGALTGHDKAFWGYFKMLRVGDWIRFYPIFPLSGAILAGSTWQEASMVLLIYMLLISYAFVVNNYFDVGIDLLHDGKVSGGKNPLASGAVTHRGVVYLMISLVALALSLSWISSKTGAYLAAINVLLLTAYSARTIRLKERIGIDVITHGTMFGAIPFISGFYLVEGHLTYSLVPFSVLAFILGCEALLAHQLVDYEMDLGSTRTTVTVFGQRWGLILLGLLTGLSIIIIVVISKDGLLPTWAAAGAGWYLLAYPVYSCRGIFSDIRHSAVTE